MENWEIERTGWNSLLGEVNVPLRSALEDFEGTSLAAVPGLLGKLNYLTGLHDGQGGYAHWGMGRVHGMETAGRAMRASHAAVFTQILRTPLRALVEDLRYSAASVHLSGAEFISSLKKRTRQLVPEGTLAVSLQHVMATLNGLSALVESQERANPPDASPLPPPAR